MFEGSEGSEYCTVSIMVDRWKYFWRWSSLSNVSAYSRGGLPIVRRFTSNLNEKGYFPFSFPREQLLTQEIFIKHRDSKNMGIKANSPTSQAVNSTDDFPSFSQWLSSMGVSLLSPPFCWFKYPAHLEIRRPKVLDWLLSSTRPFSPWNIDRVDAQVKGTSVRRAQQDANLRLSWPMPLLREQFSPRRTYTEEVSRLKCPLISLLTSRDFSKHSALFDSSTSPRIYPKRTSVAQRIF